MEKHKECLNNMCRMCTARAQSGVDINKRVPAITAQKYQDEIYILYGIDITNDDDHIHPKKICTHCFAPSRLIVACSDYNILVYLTKKMHVSDNILCFITYEF